MIRRTLHRRTHRRGAILLVVIGMLGLFAVVGLSFVLYAESEATGARNNRAARNELADPDPALAANGFLTQLIFDSSDPGSATFGHSLARSRFGPSGFQSPFTGTGVPNEALTLSGQDSTGNALPGLTLDRTQVVRFQFRNGWDSVSPDQTLTATPINKAVPWTYPDRNNFWLGYYDPTTDQITVPSFHRLDLFGSLDPTNPKWRNNGATGGGDSTGYYQTLRPRQAEHPNFPTVPMNADGTYTGDVCNLKWIQATTGLNPNPTQRMDSLWMDINQPIKTWRGKQYKALIAPLILDLGGKINLAVAGNLKGFPGTAPATTPFVHGSHHGWGPWEINPTGLLAGGANDLTGLLGLRYNLGNMPTPPLLDRNRNQSVGSLNSGLMPPQYGRIDASGTGTNNMGTPDPMTLPAAGGFAPFPNYSGRFAANQLGLTAQLVGPHGQSLSPWQWPRSATTTLNNAWVPSLEDQMRLSLRNGGPKGGPGYTGQFTPNNRLTTLFSVSQRWGEITVRTGPNPTDAARLAAIDINRPLPDYRTQTPAGLSGPISPQNIGNLIAARVARQNLARDIFVRLVVSFNLIDGTNIAYNPATGYLVFGAMVPPATLSIIQALAQDAVNTVDFIDRDDISTSFVWNPIDPNQFDVNDNSIAANQANFAPATIGNRVVFGTELPKLVLNEAYAMLNNTRRDSNAPPNTGPPPQPPLMRRPNRDNLLKKYWLELHNPLPVDPTLPDSAAARLQYVPGLSQVFDGTTGAPAAYAGPQYPVYQIEVADVPAGGMGIAQPYTAFLATNPLGYVANHAAVPVPDMIHKIVLNNYTPHNPQPMGGVLAAPTDATNVVLPANGGAAGQGYFIIGPEDLMPSAVPVPQNLHVGDPPAMPMGPVNALAFDTGTRDPANAAATGGSVILLRRLANPYLPAQPDPAQPFYNPFMTVDYLENVPTRDRAQFDSNDDRAAGGGMWTPSAAPSIGRRHPYAAAPVYGTPAAMGVVPAVLDQNPAMPPMPAATLPPNTMGQHNGFNNPAHLDNATGLAWLAHLDREVVNFHELMHSSQSPARLTQTFFTGASYQGHLLPLPGALPPRFVLGRIPDLLQTGSRLPGVPLGGREPGRVNINSVGDLATLNAVLDPQTGNLFQAPFVVTAWNNAGVGLLPSRTPTASALGGANNQPSATRFEITAGGTPGADEPFSANAGDAQLTLLRGAGGTVVPPATAPYPFLYNPPTTGHIYNMAEPVRKGWNNLTTVSDGFLVVFTVGYFEVDSANRLGKELYDKVPGDLRAQFGGIVNRTALTIDPTPGLPAGQFALGPKPWETKLAEDAQRGGSSFLIEATPGPGANQFTVYDEGNPVILTAPGGLVADTGPLLRLGHAAPNLGGDGEWVRVDSVAVGPQAGTVRIGINTTPSANPALPPYSTAFNFFHGGHTRVSNAQIGNPGPIANFDYREPTGRFRGVLPYFMRIVP